MSEKSNIQPCKGTAPVSYTHLDVYKRQVLAILGPIAFAISVWDGFQSTLTQWICRYIPVSYTHLDVYKRQPTT